MTTPEDLLQKLKEICEYLGGEFIQSTEEGRVSGTCLLRERTFVRTVALDHDRRRLLIYVSRGGEGLVTIKQVDLPDEYEVSVHVSAETLARRVLADLGTDVSRVDSVYVQVLGFTCYREFGERRERRCIIKIYS